MKRASYILWVMLIICLPQLLKAQVSAAEKLEKMVQECVSKGYAATVYLMNYDTVAQRADYARGSGVVISRDGFILTAGHVSKPGDVFQVVFPDGRKCLAKGLGKFTRFDTAVLKITTPGDWPFAEMGWSSSLEVNEPCVSIAYPVSIVPPQAVVRFGYVADLLDERKKMLRSTCLMEPGDSGGPLFDLNGRVIAIHSNVTVGLENNFEAPIDNFRKYWTSYLKPVDYKELPPEEPIPADPLLDGIIVYGNIDGKAGQFAGLENRLKGYSIELVNAADSTVATATVINADKNIKKNLLQDGTLLVSKNSSIKEEVGVKTDKGIFKKARILYRDKARDLVLLGIETKIKTAINLSKVTRDTLTYADLGKMLVSPQPLKEGQLSVVGSLQFDFPGNLSSGYLGSGLAYKDGKYLIGIVQEQSPSSIAGLSVGDEILEVNGTLISSPEAFVREIQKNFPGDDIRLSYKRGEDIKEVQIKLGERPVVTRRHPAEHFEGGKSERRDGFRDVFVHDGKVKPNECGGPVFYLRGNFMGINIARVSRTSTVAVSPLSVFDFVNEALLKHDL